jgi:hypothetical protein
VTNKKGRRVDAGNYYGERTAHGPLEPAPPGVPDHVICRRVVDYAPHPVPAGAEFTTCSQCNALIAYNPQGPHQGVPKICMQCARIMPLPMDA